MTRTELNAMTTKELRAVATELNITGRWDMKKAELVEAIANKQQKLEELAEEANKKLAEKLEAEKAEQIEDEATTVEVTENEEQAEVEVKTVLLARFWLNGQRISKPKFIELVGGDAKGLEKAIIAAKKEWRNGQEIFEFNGMDFTFVEKVNGKVQK